MSEKSRVVAQFEEKSSELSASEIRNTELCADNNRLRSELELLTVTLASIFPKDGKSKSASHPEEMFSDSLRTSRSSPVYSPVASVSLPTTGTDSSSSRWVLMRAINWHRQFFSFPIWAISLIFVYFYALISRVSPSLFSFQEQQKENSNSPRSISPLRTVRIQLWTGDQLVRIRISKEKMTYPDEFIWRIAVSPEYFSFMCYFLFNSWKICLLRRRNKWRIHSEITEVLWVKRKEGRIRIVNLLHHRFRARKSQTQLPPMVP